MTLKNASKGFFIGLLYGLILLLIEDAIGLFVAGAGVSLKQFIISLIIYVFIFAALGLITGLLLSLFNKAGRKTTDDLFSLNWILTIFTLFLWFYLALKPVIISELLPFSGGYIKTGLMWAAVVCIIALIIRLVIVKSVKDARQRSIVFLSVNIALAYLAAAYFKIYKNPEIVDYFRIALPFWKVLAFISTAGIFTLTYYIVKRLVHSAAKNSGWLVTGSTLFLASMIIGISSAAINSHRPGVHKNTTPAAGDYNVILIIADALRADHLSLYGYDRKTSPVMEKYASEGVVFDNAYSMSSYTKMSMSSLLTSRFAEMNGAFDWEGALPQDLTLLPEMMQNIGYRTALFSANPFVTPEFQYTQGIEDFSYIKGRNAKQLIFPGDILLTYFPLAAEPLYKLGLYDSENSLASAEMMNKRIFPWLDKNKDSRFFLYLHYMDTHMPIAPKNQIYSKGKFADFEQMKSVRSTHDSQDTLEYSEEIKDISISRYDDSVIKLDKGLNQLFTKLQELDLRKNTLVIFTADHGDEYFDRGFTGHGHSLFQEVVHVPLMILFPGQEHKGARISEQVKHLDIVPTILDCLGAPAENQLEGTSLLPLIAGDTGNYLQNSKPWFASVYPYEEGWKFNNIKAVMKDNYKYIRCYYNGKPGIEEFLFNVAVDRSEKNNLILSQPEIGADLSKMMDNYIVYSDSARALLSDDNQTEISTEQKDKLKAIGYVQ